jgi:hypothetical protein
MGVPDSAGRAAVTAIDLHLVPVVPGAADDPVLVERLGDGEWEAVHSFGFAADRDRAVTARAAARLEVGRRLGLHPRLVPLVPPEVTGGRPVVRGANLGVSWSHSGGWVALALAPGKSVGVDIEEVPEQVPVKALARFGLGSIQEFVAREAAGKATGVGWSDSWPEGVSVRPFTAPAGYLGAVAAPGDDWSVSIQSPESRDLPAEASAAAAGVWDTTGAGARRAARLADGPRDEQR